MKGLRAIDGMWGKSGYRRTVRRLSLCRRSVEVIITPVGNLLYLKALCEVFWS